MALKKYYFNISLKTSDEKTDIILELDPLSSLA
jgi:hypothetical protein